MFQFDGHSEFLNLPDVPKSKISSSNLLSKTIDALHKGQYVTVTGIPPISSFTISCQVKTCIG